jgi:OmpA-OmpF porin, OOP family
LQQHQQQPTFILKLTGMKKLVLLFATVICFLVTYSQGADFVPGANVIFEDNFSQDPVGDLPAKWATSGEGQVVELDGFPGKWFRINAGNAVCPELKKKLPEDCTIEFDLVIKGESCPVLFGTMPFSTVTAGNVYYKKIFVTLQRMVGYPPVVFGKDVQDLGNKNTVSMDSYVDRIAHISLSLNKTRFRAYVDETKVVDLPKLLTPEYRNNFFVAGGEVIPAPEEGIYISNVRIAAGEADARRLLIKQLYEQGAVLTSDVQFAPNTNTLTPESLPALDNLGQAMQTDPNLNIQLNSLPATATEGLTPADPNAQPIPAPDMGSSGSNQIFNKEALKAKAEKIKAYLINKFKLEATRILTDAKQKATTALNKTIDSNKTLTKAKNFLLEIVKL